MSNLFLFYMFTKKRVSPFCTGISSGYSNMSLEEAIMQNQSMKISQHKTEPKDNEKLKVDLHF